MKISQDVRMYAASMDITEMQAMQQGMEDEAVELIESSAEIGIANLV